MGEFRFKRLVRFQTSRQGEVMNLSLPLPRSRSGKIDRCCPNDNCTPGRFQLGPAQADRVIAEGLEAVVRRPPGEPGTTCPYCGIDAPDEEFGCAHDIDAVTDYLKQTALADIQEGVREMLHGLEMDSKFLSIRLEGVIRSKSRSHCRFAKTSCGI